MIHYRCSCDRFERAQAPAVIDYTMELEKLGLVEKVFGPDATRDFKATEKGEAFLEMVCRTPLPRLAWINDKDQVVSFSDHRNT